MSKYTYIVNIDNAIDVSHFRMYFHESVSRKKLSLYSIESLRDLPDKVEHIIRHMDRNVFQSDENELIICTARVWGRETDINWWTLMLQARIFTACSAVAHRKISKIRLIIVDNDNGELPEEKVFRQEADRALLRQGCIRDADPSHRCITEPWLKETGAAYLAADEQGRQQILDSVETLIPDNPLMSDFIKDTLRSFAGNADVHTLAEIYAEYFERNVLDKVRNIDTCIMPVSGSDNAEKRIAQLRLVTFLIDITGRKLGERAAIAAEFDAFEFDPAIEAARLKRYTDKVIAEYLRLKKIREKTRPEVKVSFSSMHKLSQLTEDRLIGNKKDAESIVEKISDFRNMPDWEDDYMSLINEIAAYESKLDDYGRELNEEFHYKKQPEMLVHETVTYENEKEALKIAEEEARLANENSYKERGKGDAAYAALLDISAQLHNVGNYLRKLNKARNNKKNSSFLRLMLFAASVIIIPYCVSQTYIFRGMANGNILPLICVTVLLLAVAFAKPFAEAALNRAFRREVRKLSELVQRYFESIQTRQQLFHDNVDCMADIWNAERKLEACREVVNARADQNRRVDLHRDALEEYAGMMGYFSSFIDNYYNEENSTKIDDPVSQIDPKKDITDNGIYWIGNVADIV